MKNRNRAPEPDFLKSDVFQRSQELEAKKSSSSFVVALVLDFLWKWEVF
jgi:hypothetical protein